jgi:hypothetical protein
MRLLVMTRSRNLAKKGPEMKSLEELGIKKLRGLGVRRIIHWILNYSYNMVFLMIL